MDENSVWESKCSFCGKSADEVTVIAGPGVFICRECVGLCVRILKNDGSWEDDEPGPEEDGDGIL